MGRRPSCSCRGLCLDCGSNWCGSLQHFCTNQLELCRLNPNYNNDKYYNHYSDSHNNGIRQNAAHGGNVSLGYASQCHRELAGLACLGPTIGMLKFSFKPGLCQRASNPGNKPPGPCVHCSQSIFAGDCKVACVLPPWVHRRCLQPERVPRVLLKASSQRIEV